MRVSLKNVNKDFDGVAVLRDINFDDKITSLAIIGPSGGGKSTLLRILGGLLEPSSGTIAVDGYEVIYEERQLASYRAQIGFVFQQNGLFDHLNARKNIALPLQVVHGKTEEESLDRANALLDRFGLHNEGDKLPIQLSGGQQQRAAIARAIAASPKLILLDEPTSALDPEYTSEVLDVISDLEQDGMRFIIVTHEMGFARNACDKMAFLFGGKLLEYGSSAQMFDDPKAPELQHFLSKLLEWKL